jgi:hypothetical protein
MQLSRGGDDGDACSARLLSWLARHCAAAGEPAPAVAVRTDAHGCRGLVCVADAAAGDVLLTVPWRLALTVPSAVRRLLSLERAGVPLTRMPLARLLPLCAGEAPAASDAAAATPALMPPGCGSATLLALGLLAELRDPRSPHAPYAAALPAPAGSALAGVARGPAAGAHLALCTGAQLRALACPPLAAEVEAERERLAALHAVLFGRDDPQVRARRLSAHARGCATHAAHAAPCLCLARRCR